MAIQQIIIDYIYSIYSIRIYYYYTTIVNTRSTLAALAPTSIQQYHGFLLELYYDICTYVHLYLYINARFYVIESLILKQAF